MMKTNNLWDLCLKQETKHLFMFLRLLEFSYSLLAKFQATWDNFMVLLFLVKGLILILGYQLLMSSARSKLSDDIKFLF